jgi:hypothetical protein
MGRKPRPSRLATVTNIPPANRPYKTLTSAVTRSASEREVLVLLRERLAAQLDGEGMPPAAFSSMVRQFRSVDAAIKQIDMAEAAAAAAADDEVDDGEESAGWDPSVL